MASPADNPGVRTELFQLGLLLLADALFYFFVIPAGIVDPEGMNLDQGLPPSFSAKLVAVLAAMLMLARVAQLIVFERSGSEGAVFDNDERAEVDADVEPAQVGLPVRGLAGIAAGLTFAYVLTPIFGFFAAGLLLLIVLLRILGETRPMSLMVPPVIVTVMVWALFEQVLSIRMPVGMLFGE
jgi:hypothetical protein